MNIIQPDELTVSTWSGGTTTQIAIFPEDAVYGERNFIWRISSATVDDEVSTFTALPDYDRFILMQEGTVFLSHDGGAEIELPPWQVHAFDGGVQTISRGKATDFNLMLRKGKACAEVTVINTQKGAEQELSVQKDCLSVLYAGGCDFTIYVSGKKQNLKKGGILVLSEGDFANVRYISDGQTGHAVICNIHVSQ